MRGVLVVASVMLAVVVSCKAVSGWWAEPITPGQPVVTPVGPGGAGGTATFTPPAVPTEPTVVPVPGGGTVTVSPPPPAVTKGDAVAAGASGVAGAYFGPLAGYAVSALMGLLGQALAKKQ